MEIRVFVTINQGPREMQREVPLPSSSMNMSVATVGSD
jgi:hypothetical protein